MWIREYDGEPFYTYADAYDALCEDIEIWELAEAFRNWVDLTALFEWAIKQEAFWSDSKMMDAYDQAMSVLFEERFTEEEDED